MRITRDTIVRLLVFGAVFRADCLECPNHCFCFEREGLVRTDCVRRNLINTFLGISHRTQILDLSHNVISILHGNEFLDANLRQLQELRLSNNQLHKIDKFSFNGLHLLTDLDLSFNSIEYLNPSTFRFNPNLRTLNVSFNPLSLRADEPFLSTGPALRLLDLANCRLDFVSPLTFSHLASLRVLNVTRNHIRELQFPEGLENLKYLDVSGNEIPCDDQTYALLQSLRKRKIQFQAFCETSQKMEMFPVTEIEKEDREGNRMEMSLQEGGNETSTEKVPPQRSILNDVSNFLQSIPSFYAIICGIQVGVFIGSFSTYICLKKSRKRQEDDRGQPESREYRHGEADNLIPLNTSPGTPPSPYHSRFFPSSFSLSAT